MFPARDPLAVPGAARDRSKSGLPSCRGLPEPTLCELTYVCTCGHIGKPRADLRPEAMYLVNCPACLKEQAVKAVPVDLVKQALEGRPC